MTGFTATQFEREKIFPTKGPTFPILVSHPEGSIIELSEHLDGDRRYRTVVDLTLTSPASLDHLKITHAHHGRVGVNSDERVVDCLQVEFNGMPVEMAAVFDGDSVQVSPFFLEVELMELFVDPGFPNEVAVQVYGKPTTFLEPYLFA